MKVLLHVNYFEGAGKFDTLFKLIRVNGADGVELRATRYYDMDKAGYRALVEELKQKNPDLEFAFGYPLHFSSVDAETQKREFAEFVEFIDWAGAKVGTTLLNLFTDALFDPKQTYWHYDKYGSAMADDALFARHAAGLTAVGRELEKRHMLGALETHNCYIHDLAKPCRKLLDLIGSDAIGINYDHGNIFLNRNGESIPEVLEILKGRIYYAHLKNLMKTQDWQYMATHLDAGHIDTYQVLAGLRNELKSGMFAIEYACTGDGVVAARRDMEYIRYLREWLDI